MPVLNDGTTVTARRPARPPLTVRAPSRLPRTALVVRGPRGTDGVSPEQLQEHIDDPTPHPAYDDMHNLTLIFENHLI